MGTNTKGYISSVMKKHDILIKYISEEKFAEQLRYGGLYMCTPKYYREQGMQNMSMGDPEEFDDLYPIWCASIFQYQNDLTSKWKIEQDSFEIEVTMTKQASVDILRAFKGFTGDDGTVFEPLGSYAVIIFNAAKYIGNLVEGFMDANFNFADRSVKAIPIECGKVSYGEVMLGHPKLYKADDRFKYQREYRIRLGLNVSPSKYDVGLNLKDNRIFNCEYDEIGVWDKKTIINDFNKNGFITFKNSLKMDRAFAELYKRN